MNLDKEVIALRAEKDRIMNIIHETKAISLQECQEQALQFL